MAYQKSDVFLETLNIREMRYINNNLQKENQANAHLSQLNQSKQIRKNKYYRNN